MANEKTNFSQVINNFDRYESGNSLTFTRYKRSCRSGKYNITRHSIAPDKGQRTTKDMISVTMDTLVSKDKMTQEDTDDDFEDDTSYPGCSCCRPR